VSTSMMRRPLLVSMADCSASQLTTSQLLPSALAPPAATDHSLAIGGEGVGVVGVAGILSPLDGGDAPSGSVQAHSPKKVSTNLSEIGT
jgi:hypothetical protein